MEYEKEYNGKSTPQKALKMLAEEGMAITLEEAEQILNFLTDIADRQVCKFLKDTD